MPSTFRKTYDSFLLKLGIDLRYSRAYSKKREDLLKNDPEYRYCEHATFVFFIGTFLLTVAGVSLTCGLYDNFPLISMCFGIGFAFIVILTLAMTLSLMGKSEYIFSQTPIEIAEERL